MSGPHAFLQLRWARADDEAPDDGRLQKYVCHYELVIPLRKHDLRREDNGNGQVVRDATIVFLSKTFRTSGSKPNDAPYRDGAHALWDSEALGHLPIYVVDLDGNKTAHKAYTREHT